MNPGLLTAQLREFLGIATESSAELASSVRAGYAIGPYFASPESTASLVFDGKKGDMIVVPIL